MRSRPVGFISNPWPFVDSAGCAGPSHLMALGDPAVATESAVRHRLKHEVLASATVRAEAVYEFWVPCSSERADVAVIGEELCGYEIKTERDTLKRLPRQAAAYGRLFDQCTIVGGERHIGAAIQMLPDWWGITAIARSADAQFRFVSVRAGARNESVDPETLVRLLWREEVRAALSAIGTEPDPKASRSTMWKRLLESVDIEQLRAIVRRALLGRNPTSLRFSSRRFLPEVI
jgi:hypothetical protein